VRAGTCGRIGQIWRERLPEMAAGIGVHAKCSLAVHRSNAERASGALAGHSDSPSTGGRRPARPGSPTWGPFEDFDDIEKCSPDDKRFAFVSDNVSFCQVLRRAMLLCDLANAAWHGIQAMCGTRCVLWESF
jgi:hypothetical protein